MRRLGDTPGAGLDATWTEARPGAFETAIVTGTAALALHGLGVPDSARLAHTLWTAHAAHTAA